MKKITAILLLVSLLFSCLVGCGVKYTVNSVNDETGREVPGAFSVYGGDDVGFGFLYPHGMLVSYSVEDGVCLRYSEGSGYLLVCRIDRSGMSPEKYFKSSDNQILDTFESVQSTKIYQVPVGDKTLYLTRYQCDNMVIDRYLELYKNCFILYTAVSEAAGEMNTAIYYAAKSLSIASGAYIGEFTDEVVSYRQDDTGLDISLPAMLDTKQLTVGYYSSSDDAVMLCILCTQDDSGAKIYNRQDFIDRASSDPSFVAGYLGTDSAEFGSGSEVCINGRSFYSYPMSATVSGETFSGSLSIANADESGCVIICYGVREGSARFDDLSEVCRSCVETLKF